MASYRGCNICLKDHFTVQCPDLKEQNYAGRKRLCEQKNICPRCLGFCLRGNYCANPEDICNRCFSGNHCTMLHPDEGSSSEEDENEADCLVCTRKHELMSCYAFLSSDISTRIETCRFKKICQICLTKSHTGPCYAPGLNCKICGSVGHHTYLHDSEYGREMCPRCYPEQKHLLEHCVHFLRLNLAERGDFVERNGICRCCLHKIHPTRLCQSALEGSTTGCVICKAYDHHTLLHNASNSADPREFQRLQDMLKERLSKIRRENDVRVVVQSTSSTPAHTPLKTPVKTPLKTPTKKTSSRSVTQQGDRSAASSSRRLFSNLARRYDEIQGPRPGPTDLRFKLNQQELARGLAQGMQLSSASALPAPGISLANLPAGFSAEPIVPLNQEGKKRTREPDHDRAETPRLADKPKCHLCSGDKHKLDVCPDFVTSGIRERERMAKGIRPACLLCLSVDHRSTECNSVTKFCGYHQCELSHHPLLHRRRYWSKDGKTKNQEYHVRAQIEEQKSDKCGICETRNHRTEHCSLWPAGRLDRRTFCLNHNLCEICLDKGHCKSLCHSREMICGVNRCPEHHHPLLHPVQFHPIDGPNRPNYADRAPVNQLDRLRVIKPADGDQAEQVLREKWAGKTKLAPQVYDQGVWFEQGHHQRCEVTLEHAEFLRLYQAYADMGKEAASLGVQIVAESLATLTTRQIDDLQEGSVNRNPLMTQAIEYFWNSPNLSAGRAPRASGTSGATLPSSQAPTASSYGYPGSSPSTNQSQGQSMSQTQSASQPSQESMVIPIDPSDNTEDEGSGDWKPCPLSKKKRRRKMSKPVKIERKDK